MSLSFNHYIIHLVFTSESLSFSRPNDKKYHCRVLPEEFVSSIKYLSEYDIDRQRNSIEVALIMINNESKEKLELKYLANIIETKLKLHDLMKLSNEDNLKKYQKIKFN